MPAQQDREQKHADESAELACRRRDAMSAGAAFDREDLSREDESRALFRYAAAALPFGCTAAV